MVEASFANQTSNLSALGAAMGSFHRVLEVTQSSRSLMRNHDKESLMFLDAQHKRLAGIEDDLMTATGCILPNSTSASTITELAEVCRMMQEANRKKIGCLLQRLVSMGATSIEPDEVFSPGMPSPATNFFSIGEPLEMVEEADVETEGATTPGSMINPSPFASNRKPSISPATPKIDPVPFSPATTALRQTISPSGINRSSSSPHRLSRSSDSMRQMNFEGFQDDDDMITIDTHRSGVSTTVNRRKSFGDLAERESKGQHQFINEMESMLDKVEESLLEGRPSDEVTLQVDRRSVLETEDTKSEEDNVSFSDDSTDVIATQVASTTRRGRMSPVYASKGKKHHVTTITNQAPQRPTQILFDNNAPSPAHTNITFDATILNETVVSTVLFQDDDNTVMTPILDRYRLDPDDNSVGIKVVPNKRGTSSRLREPLEDVSEEQTPMASNLVTTFIKEGEFMSPKGLPGTISARKKKQFRKTPLPKKVLHVDNSMDTTDENSNPNLPVVRSSSSVVNASPLARPSMLGSFTVPPLRQSSLEKQKNETRDSCASSSTMSQSFIETNKTSQSTFSETSSVEKALIPGTSQTHNRSAYNERFERETAQMTKWMEHITMAEYDVAPRIVQVQVRRDEANLAIDILEGFFTLRLQENPTSALEFGEQQGYALLGSSFHSTHKCKSILMSLCHFRRLLMHRDKEMRFSVNQFLE